MTNPDPRGGVPYTVGEKVLYTEANLIRTGIVNSIDGSAGGSYSPSTAITIAGSNGLIIGGTGSAARLRYTSRQVTRAIPQPLGGVERTEAMRRDVRKLQIVGGAL